MTTGEWINSEQLQSIDDPEEDHLQKKKPRNGWTIGGDCPILRKYLENKDSIGWMVLKFFVAFTRGFSQVTFANNPITGIILMIGVASIVPGTFVACSITGFLGQLISMLLKEPKENIDNGLTVFNPLIFGAVSYYFVPIIYGKFDGFSMLMILLGVIFIAYFWRACENSCVPCLTMPFNLAELILLFTLKNANSQLDISTSEILTWPLLSMNNVTAPVTTIAATTDASKRFVENATIVVHDLDWGMIVRASVTSASQLFATDSVPLGAILYLSVLIYSPITCLFGYMGSLIGSLVGFQIGATYESVYCGLWGFNGYLIGTSLGGSFLVLNGQVAIATFVAVVLSAFLQHVLQIIFLPIGLPVGTIPYVLTTWLFIGLGKSSNGTFSYPITISFPEAQRHELLLRHRIAQLKKNKKECDPELHILNGKEPPT
ncbi:PREDICTED: urea transporter 1-like [Ceratosolen solmsi marchali]|uniref:Urea transporter 1-like n=1 Tax=Ceratosolen solmsi marchali TaxID=326594 RepID=A0AAJ7DZ44_9HYME|nr:PREDICTED: urea transporter 1-like [Ceratosolen solmsi marchali]